MNETKNGSPPVGDPENKMKTITNDDICQVLVEQQSRIVNEVNSNINDETARSTNED